MHPNVCTVQYACRLFFVGSPLPVSLPAADGPPVSIGGKMSSRQTRKVLLVLAAFVAAAAVATPEAEPGPRGRGRGRGGGGQRIAEKEGRKERKCSSWHQWGKY